jgi:hypothetical protein
MADASDPEPTLAHIREIARYSGNVILLKGALKKGRRRGITFGQVVKCCQLGTIIDGPFKNERFEWQVTLQRHAAGEEIRVVVIVDLEKGKLWVRSNH